MAHIYKLIGGMMINGEVTDDMKRGILIGIELLGYQGEKWFDNDDHAMNFRENTVDSDGFSGWKEIHTVCGEFLYSKEPDEEEMKKYHLYSTSSSSGHDEFNIRDYIDPKEYYNKYCPSGLVEYIVNLGYSEGDAYTVLEGLGIALDQEEEAEEEEEEKEEEEEEEEDSEEEEEEEEEDYTLTEEDLDEIENKRIISRLIVELGYSRESAEKLVGNVKELRNKRLEGNLQEEEDEEEEENRTVDGEKSEEEDIYYTFENVLYLIDGNKILDIDTHYPMGELLPSGIVQFNSDTDFQEHMKNMYSSKFPDDKKKGAELLKNILCRHYHMTCREQWSGEIWDYQIYHMKTPDKTLFLTNQGVMAKKLDTWKGRELKRILNAIERWIM